MARQTKQKTHEISSLNLDIGLKELAKERGINLSELMNTAMKGLLEVDSTLDSLKKKKRECIVQLAVIEQRIQEVEICAIEKITHEKIVDAEKQLYEHRKQTWIKIAKHKIKQEGSVPKTIETAHMKILKCTREELYEF